MQLYFFCEPFEMAELKTSVIKCIGDIVEWITSNSSNLNLAKSEFLWCVAAQLLHLIECSKFQLDDGDVTSSDRLTVLCQKSLSLLQCQHEHGNTSFAYQFFIVSTVTYPHHPENDLDINGHTDCQ